MRKLRILPALSVVATVVTSCDRSPKYIEPPPSTYSTARFTLAPESTDSVVGALVSPDFFATSNVRPLLGRFFAPVEYESSAGQPVVVISDDVWRRRFNAAPQLIGTRIPLNGQPVFVVGVAPPGFTAPHGAALWVPRVPR